MIALLPLASLALGSAAGYWLGRSGRWRTFLLLMLAVIAVFAWGALSLGTREANGFDGVGEATLLVLGLLPLEIGGLAGAGLALFRNRRAHDG